MKKYVSKIQLFYILYNKSWIQPMNPAYFGQYLRYETIDRNRGEN